MALTRALLRELGPLPVGLAGDGGLLGSAQAAEQVVVVAPVPVYYNHTEKSILETEQKKWEWS